MCCVHTCACACACARVCVCVCECGCGGMHVYECLYHTSCMGVWVRTRLAILHCKRQQSCLVQTPLPPCSPCFFNQCTFCHVSTTMQDMAHTQQADMPSACFLSPSLGRLFQGFSRASCNSCLPEAPPLCSCLPEAPPLSHPQPLLQGLSICLSHFPPLLIAFSPPLPLPCLSSFLHDAPPPSSPSLP